MKNVVKKIITYLFLLIALVGFFGWAGEVSAAECTRLEGGDPAPTGCTPDTTSLGTCVVTLTGPEPVITKTERMLYIKCMEFDNNDQNAVWTKESLGGSQGTIAENTPTSTQTPFEQSLDKGCAGIFTWTLTGCLLKLVYYTYFQLPTFVLWVSALFFNALISLVIQSSMYSTPFITEAWGVVRDLSNIFFILVLLYIAITIILDMAGHEVKKMIGKVLVMALLINFSMFFVNVVIDTSNILALVFYNKLDVITLEPGQTTPREYTPSTPNNEKDLSGAMFKNFNATTLLNKPFIEKLKATTKSKDDLPFALTLGIMVISGTIMLWAAYTFFVSGIFFLGRLVELWVLLIFSPFAFMSFPVPLLKSVPYIGWDEWLKKLIATSFMAPIFMFFLYLIFKLLKANIFSSFTSGEGAMAMILGVVIPAMLIMGLLKKGVDFAKKGGGMFGELIMTGAKMVGGLALGAATGGASMAATATVGKYGAQLAESKWMKDKVAEGKFGSRLLQSGAKSLGSASFDVRGIKIAGKTLGSATGMGVGSARTGGFVERKKEQIAKRQKRAKELEVGEDEKLKQDLNRTEADLHHFMEANSETIEALDKVIEKTRQEVSDKEKIFNAAKGTPQEDSARTALTLANGELNFAKQNKKEFREGNDYMITNSAGVSEIKPGTGAHNINRLEEQKRNQTHAIKNENTRRKHEYADTVEGGWEKTTGFVFSGGIYTPDIARKTAQKIRMDAKIEEVGGKGHGEGGGDHAPASHPAPKPAAAKPAPAAGGAGHGDGGHGGGH